MKGQIARINIEKSKELENQHFSLLSWAKKGIRVRINTEPTIVTDLNNMILVNVTALEGHNIKGCSTVVSPDILDIITDIKDYPLLERIIAKFKNVNRRA